MAKLANLKDLYVGELEDLYDAEKRIVKALPKVAEAAREPELRDPSVRDAAIIAAAQRVEHYEIAAYGTVRKWAEQLQDSSGMRIREETLQEEKEADKKLTNIAVSKSNVRAETRAASS